MAERRDDRDMRGTGGLNNPLLDDLLLTAAAAAASGSSQPNLGNMLGPTRQQQQQQQYQSWSSSFDHLNLPSAYSGWYGQPGINFGSGADLLSGAFPQYDDLLSATVNQGAINQDSLLSEPNSFCKDSQPITSMPSSGGQSSGAFQQGLGMGYSAPNHTPTTVGGNGFQLGEPPSGAQGPSIAGDSGSTFQQAAADGRSMYTDALSQWDMYQGSIYSPFRTDVFQEPKTVDPSPWENQNLQTPVMTSHSDFIKSPPPPIPTPSDQEVPVIDNSMQDITPQSVLNLADQIFEGITATSTSSESVRSASPQQPSTASTAIVNSRLSYSDVAKHAKTSSNVPKQQQKSSSEWLAGENLPPEFPSVPVILKPPQRKKPKSSRHSHKNKSDSESSLKPDSKYGLDIFDDLGRERRRAHNSECSTPQSRKSSASSITSASSGCADDSRHIGLGDASSQARLHIPLDSRGRVNAYDTADVVGAVGSKYDIRKGDLKNHHKFSQGTQAHVQDNRAGSASPHISTQPKHKKPNTDSTKSNQTQPKVFFDPKRIFQTQTSSSKQSGKSGGTEKSSIPNNQQPSAATRREHPEVLLNNGKPTSSLFSGGNVGKPANTTYINNDLRQHKKQTNTEERNSPHRNTTDSYAGEHRRAGVRHRAADSQTSSHQGASRSNSAGRRKKPETSSTAKKQTTGPEDRPKRNRKPKDDGPNPLNILCEYFALTC